jgi:hypothetical protein
VYLGLLADDICIYATDRKEDYELRKLQRGLNATKTWCERWNIKINVNKTQAIYFSHRLRSPEARLTLNGQNIPFVSNGKCLCVTFDKRITWKVHNEIIGAKDFRTFITIYFLFRNERLSANIKLTLHKALIRSVMAYVCPAWALATDTYLLKLQRLQNKILRTMRFAHGFQPSVCIRLHNKIVQATRRSHTTS